MSVPNRPQSQLSKHEQPVSRSVLLAVWTSTQPQPALLQELGTSRERPFPSVFRKLCFTLSEAAPLTASLAAGVRVQVPSQPSAGRAQRQPAAPRPMPSAPTCPWLVPILDDARVRGPPRLWFAGFVLVVQALQRHMPEEAPSGRAHWPHQTTV